MPRSKKGTGFVETPYYSEIGFLIWLCSLHFSEDTVYKSKSSETSLLQHNLFVCLTDVKKHKHTSAVEHFIYGKADQ